MGRGALFWSAKSGRDCGPEGAHAGPMSDRTVGDVKAMKGSPTLRLRVGDYRVIFTEDYEVLDVLDVGHRSGVYH